LTSAADSHGTVTYGYDDGDRVKTYTGVHGGVLTYSYDGAARRTSRQDALGGVLTSTYDSADRLVSLVFTGTGAVGATVHLEFGYSNRDELTTLTRYSDLGAGTGVGTSVYAYDAARRVTAITHKDSNSTTLSSYSYSYDNADRVTSEVRWSKVGATTYSGTATYGYDSASQLTSDGTATYSYDFAGNRTQVVTPTMTYAYTTTLANRLQSDGVYTYTYDAEGNLTVRKSLSTADVVTYSYDTKNRLTSVLEKSDGVNLSLSVTYVYDVEGKRISEDRWQSNGMGGGTETVTHFAYDGDNVWADLDGGDGVKARYSYGAGVDQILARTVKNGMTPGTVTAYLADRQGSVRDLEDFSSKALVDHVDYDGFGGVVTEASAAAGDRYKYTGREYDPGTGLQYNRARYVAVPTGRWTSEDPSGFGAGDGNLYRYTFNDPTDRTDPSGLAAPPPAAGKWLVEDYGKYSFTHKSGEKISTDGKFKPTDTWKDKDGKTWTLRLYPVKPISAPTPAEMSLLKTQFPGWKFSLANTLSDGSLRVKGYDAEVYNKKNGFIEANILVLYKPAGADPKGKEVHWIQFVTVDKQTADDTGWPTFFLDPPRRKKDPYYDSVGGADSEHFSDTPRNAAGARDFRARLFLAQETAPKTVRIWQGLSWGYSNSVTTSPPKPAKTC
jgi:RHS repeat-associated protein